MRSTPAQRLYAVRVACEATCDTLERMALERIAFDTDGLRLWQEAYDMARDYDLTDVVRRLERIMATPPRSDAGMTIGRANRDRTARGFNALFVAR